MTPRDTDAMMMSMHNDETTTEHSNSSHYADHNDDADGERSDDDVNDVNDHSDAESVVSSRSSCSSSSSSSSDSQTTGYDECDSEYEAIRTPPPPEPPLPPPFPHHHFYGELYQPRIKQAKILRKMAIAKRKHRSALAPNEWTKYDLANTFDTLLPEMFEEMPKITTKPTKVTTINGIQSQKQAAQSAMNGHNNNDTLSSKHISLNNNNNNNNNNNSNINLVSTTNIAVSTGIDHVHTNELSVERFIREYEEPYQPVMISGLTDDWPSRHWSFASLEASPYRNLSLKCGEDDDGFPIKIKLKYFLQYLYTQIDDSPLYIFDCAFSDNIIYGKRILSDFTIPKYFTDDLFKYVGEIRRPPYRWILIGPKRSGSSIHIDPLGTSAWNTLLSGIKRWVMFPPNTPKDIVKGEKYMTNDDDNEAITYFTRILPRIKQAERERIQQGLPSLGIRECMQYPGETIFVPGGWWHSVLNIQDSIAITQNFVSKTNFVTCWRLARDGRRKMALRWFQRLACKRELSDLVERAQIVNAVDGWDFDQMIIQREQEKAEKRERQEQQRLKRLHDASMAAPMSVDVDEQGEAQSNHKKQRIEIPIVNTNDIITNTNTIITSS